MNKTTKLVLGGALAGLVTVGASAGVMAWASRGASPAASAAQPVPVPSPNLAPELATTTPAEPPAPPEPESYEPDLASEGSIRIRRLVIASGVENREPTGAADTFELGGRIYAFVEAVNENGEAAQLRVTFEPDEGESTGHVALEVPANVARFRTWAYTRHVYEPGRWEAAVRDSSGRVVARRAFDVVE
jgi:DUF2914 family protein